MKIFTDKEKPQKKEDEPRKPTMWYVRVADAAVFDDTDEDCMRYMSADVYSRNSHLGFTSPTRATTVGRVLLEEMIEQRQRELDKLRRKI
jgi:hypothetical protein